MFRVWGYDIGSRGFGGLELVIYSYLEIHTRFVLDAPSEYHHHPIPIRPLCYGASDAVRRPGRCRVRRAFAG